MTEQTILIVEDDADIRDGVRILLAGEGYRILEAENGAKALQVFDPGVDLVILDVMMPGMSGLRVCEELRKRSTVPILFLTAKSQESDKLLGLRRRRQDPGAGGRQKGLTPRRKTQGKLIAASRPAQAGRGILTTERR